NIVVLVLRLRRKIAAHGIEIKTRNGVGYYMPTEAKNRLRGVIERTGVKPCKHTRCGQSASQSTTPHAAASFGCERAEWAGCPVAIRATSPSPSQPCCA